MRPAHWLPPVLWMGVIMLLSTDTGSAAHTGELLLPLLHWLLPWASPGDLAAIHGLVRKGAHLTEYAILAALWYPAGTRGTRARRGSRTRGGAPPCARVRGWRRGRRAMEIGRAAGGERGWVSVVARSFKKKEAE